MYTMYIIYISCLSAFYIETEYLERAISRKALAYSKQHLCVPHIFFLNSISCMCLTDGILRCQKSFQMEKSMCILTI